MSQETAVLFANEAFYVAFAGRDPDTMAALWATDAEVTCIHPGWPPLAGRDAVLRSWREILANPESPDVKCRGATARIVGDVAVVLCAEVLAGGQLAATNLFVREAGGWRMIHHQASPMAGAMAAEAPPETPPTLQ